jgi:hypothetical protein
VRFTIERATTCSIDRSLAISTSKPAVAVLRISKKAPSLVQDDRSQWFHR